METNKKHFYLYYGLKELREQKMPVSGWTGTKCHFLHGPWK
jgi:hypothetical protein